MFLTVGGSCKKSDGKMKQQQKQHTKKDEVTRAWDVGRDGGLREMKLFQKGPVLDAEREPMFGSYTRLSH